MHWLYWLSLSIGTGCADRVVYPDDPNDNSDGDGDEDADEVGCGSDLGTLNGQVMEDFPWSAGDPSPAGGARVLASPTASDNSPIAIITNDNGQFSTQLPYGTYSITASSAGCISESIDLALDPCETETLLLNLIDCLDGSSTDTGVDIRG
jgi:hypothetical protein